MPKWWYRMWWAIHKWAEKKACESGDEVHDFMEHNGFKGSKGHVEKTSEGGFIWKEDRPEYRLGDK